jgi:APA family basic amino acid/polyamine antiporter
VLFGAGTAIGVSIFSVLQPAAQVAGSGLLAAVLVSALPMVLFALCYAWLGSALPVSGASYEWPRRFIHPFVGFAIAWLRILSNVGAAVVLATVLVSYLGMAVAVPTKLTMAAAISRVFALNYAGVAVAARAQLVLMLMLLVVLAAFVFLGAPSIDAKLIGSPFAAGTMTTLAAVPLMITLFLGIESAVEIGEEVRDAPRNIPLGISLAIALTAVVYLGVAVTALGLVGPKGLAESNVPLLDAARIPFGRFALPLIVGAATVSILKTMNATALVFTRSLFAMARTDVLPEALAQIHPRFGTPHRAILFGYACAMLGLLMPSSLVFLLLAVNIPTMLKYLACSLCVPRAVSNHPEVRDRARSAYSPKVMSGIGYAAALCAVAIILMGLGADVRPYLLVGAWLIIGVGYWLLRRRGR